MPVEVMTTLIVDGVQTTPTTANFNITAKVQCRRPDGTIYAPKAGEVNVQLWKMNPLWLDTLITNVDCPDGGITYLGNVTVSEQVEYQARAKHNTTGSIDRTRNRLFPDGNFIPNLPV